MNQSFLKGCFIFIFTSLLVNYSFGQLDISETYYETYGIYRSWTQGQTPGQYNNTKRVVRFEFTPNSIKKFWGNQGVMNMKWELESTYTVVQSKIMKDESGSSYYMYTTSSGTQIGCSKGSNKYLVIYDRNQLTEYRSN
ncbi:hypothetical protein [Sediminibacterium sp.]|uniref:hypothetical protein n=1 Tax=Sediminibacterium sp. TaxID=1917865 RepID=UPI003F71F072